MSKIVKIYHYNAKLTKLSDIMIHEGIFQVSGKEFLDFVDERGVSNRDILFNTFETRYKQDKITSSTQIGNESKIYSPVIFSLPSEYATQFILTSESTLQIPNDDYTAFLATEILQVMNSPEYRDDFVIKTNPKVSVFIWSKTLNGQSEFKERSIINISPFIQDLQMSNAKNGGNFTMSIAPILATMLHDSDKKPTTWSIQSDNLNTYTTNNVSSMVAKVNLNQKKDITETTPGFRQERLEGQNVFNETKIGEKIIRSQFLFTNILSENDVVFIKFGEIDGWPAVGDLSDYYIPSNVLPNQNWDMIGLIDKNSTNISSMDVNTQISGRDLIKLLIEDGTYFFQNHYTNPDNSTSIFKNKFVDQRGDRSSAANNFTTNPERMNRMIGFDAEPVVSGIFRPEARTIEYIMNLIIRALSNIEICPNGLFSHVENKTSFQYEIENDDKGADSSKKTSENKDDRQVE